MPLVIDGSSPVATVTNQSTAVNTSGSFNPPDSPLFMALWAANAQNGTQPGAPSVASSPVQSWVLDESDDGWVPTLPSGIDGQAAIWHSVVTGTPGATTVSVTNSVASGWRDAYLKVLVFTGHDPVAPVGAAIAGRQSSGSSLTASYLGTIDGGQGLMVVSDWNAGSTTGWAAATGCSILDKGTAFGISYAALQRTTADGLAGVTTSMELTGLPTGGLYHWVIAEVVSLEAAARSRQVVIDGSNAANW